MASVPVNNNLNILAGTISQPVAPTGNNAALAKQAEIVKDSFDMVMNRVSAQASNQSNQFHTDMNTMKSMPTEAADYSKQDTVQKTSDKTTDKTAKENDTKDVAGQTSKDTVEEKEAVDSKQEAVEEAGEKLVEEVAEELNVTPEEVEAAMEVLGLSAAALLNPDNMKQLLVVLSGNQDTLSLVTDAELYTHLQNLLSTVEESLQNLQEELGLTEGELNALIADMAVQRQPEETGEMMMPQMQAEETGEALEGAKDYSVTVQKDGETVQVKVSVDDASGDTRISENVTVAKDAMGQKSESGQKQAFGDNKGEGQHAANLQVQVPMQQTEVNAVAQPQPFSAHFVSTEDIMNQIMDYMKINLKSDVQEMEMQLHPASLGNINVQIASKEGVITAHFTAQNDVVKAAIESQLVQLKEQFVQQGIKVDSVEVTVGNYQFEQSFSGQEEEAGKNPNSGKKNARRINLNELNLEELPEDMDDSEKIAADMMAKSGNTVDYTA